MTYDVLIAGGSFAGLAAAVQLRGWRVLLVEPHEIGAIQTSACGTLLAVLEATGTLDSLVQVHDSLVIHLGEATIEYPMPYPFCTFDYRKLCQLLLAQADVEVVRASVLCHEGNVVTTTRGEFEARVLIDATGWRAALATHSQRREEAPTGRSFGMETSLPVRGRGLHFYYDPSLTGSHVVGWDFPAGATSRLGLGSYRGRSQLNQPLSRFLQARFGLAPNGRHGGYFTYQRLPAVTDDVLRVGDAAGHCLPLTGEGIRPALFFGARLGRLVQGVLSGECSMAEARERYRSLVDRHVRPHRYLLAAQRVLPGLPLRGIKVVGDVIRRPANLDWLMRAYWNAFDPAEFAWSAKPEFERRPLPRWRARTPVSLGAGSMSPTP
jgi:menaquinone-9 beta-reductase